jgi:hypothetical protein
VVSVASLTGEYVCVVPLYYAISKVCGIPGLWTYGLVLCMQGFPSSHSKSSDPHFKADPAAFFSTNIRYDISVLVALMLEESYV